MRNLAAHKIEEITMPLIQQAGTNRPLIEYMHDVALGYKNDLRAFDWRIIQTNFKKSGLELEHAVICEKLSEQVHQH